MSTKEKEPKMKKNVQSFFSNAMNIQRSVMKTPEVFRQKKSALNNKMKSRALLTINVQVNDFFPEFTIGEEVRSGAYPVQEAPGVLQSIAKLRERHFDLVVHCRLVWPTTHRSFVSNNPGCAKGSEMATRFGGGVGPTHTLRDEYCVEGTIGAQLHRQLEVRPEDYVLEMGRDPNADLNATPFDQLNRYYNKRNKHNCSRYHHSPEQTDFEHLEEAGLDKGLGKLFERFQITEIFVAGIGLDFGVQKTALQARHLLAQVHGWEFEEHSMGKKEMKVMIVRQCCAKFGAHSDMSIIRSLEQQRIDVISMTGQEMSRLKRLQEDKLLLYKALEKLAAKTHTNTPASTPSNKPSKKPGIQSRHETRVRFCDLLSLYCVLRLMQLQQKCRDVKRHGEDEGRGVRSVFQPDMLMSKLLAQSGRWDNPSEARMKIVQRAVRQALDSVSPGVEIDAYDGGVMTPLHIAVRLNLVEAVRFLLHKNDNSSESKDSHTSWRQTRDEFGDTPLIYCLRGLQAGTSSGVRREQKRSLEIAKMLIKNPLDANVKGYMGMTPLMWACIAQNLKAVQLLVPPENPTLLLSMFDAQCNFGSSVLHYTIGALDATNAPAIIFHLTTELRGYATRKHELFQVRDCLGLTVMHLAAKNDLLLKIGAHPRTLRLAAIQMYAADKATIPLHLAAWNGSATSIQRLLSMGHKSPKDGAGLKFTHKFNSPVRNHTALDLALLAKHKQCAKLLVSNGCHFQALSGVRATEFAHLMLLECDHDAFDGIMRFARQNKLNVDNKLLRLISELRYGPPGICTFHMSGYKAFPQFMWECLDCKVKLCNKCKDICPCNPKADNDNNAEAAATSKLVRSKKKHQNLKALGYCENLYCHCERRTCNCGASLSSVEQQGYNYNPEPIDTSAVTSRFYGSKSSRLPDSISITREQLDGLVSKLSEHSHTTWAIMRMKGGWTFGEKRDNEKKKHPLLRPYQQLSDSEQNGNIEQARESVLTVLALDWEIIPPPPISPTRLRGPPILSEADWLSPRKRKKVLPNVTTHRPSELSPTSDGAEASTETDAPGAWNPTPTIDTSEVMLTDDLLPLRDKLGRNSHDQWARSKMDAGFSYAPERTAQGEDSSGAKQSHLLVPFNCLTKYEQETNSESASEMLRCIIALNFKISPLQRDEESGEQNTNVGSIEFPGNARNTNPKRNKRPSVGEDDDAPEQKKFDIQDVKVQFFKICLWACACNTTKPVPGPQLDPMLNLQLNRMLNLQLNHLNPQLNPHINPNLNPNPIPDPKTLARTNPEMFERVIKELVDLKAPDAVYQSDSLGHSALYLAAKNGNHEIVSLLLNRPEIGIIFDSKGLSALSIASILGHYQLSRRLMKISYPLRSRKGNTVLVSLRPNSGQTKHLVDEVDSYGYTVLHYAVMSGARDVVSVLASQVVLTDGAGIDVGVNGQMRTESEVRNIYDQTFNGGKDTLNEQINVVSVMGMWNRIKAPGLGSRIFPSLSKRIDKLKTPSRDTLTFTGSSDDDFFSGDETKIFDGGFQPTTKTTISPLGLAVVEWNIGAVEVLVGHDANPMALSRTNLRCLPTACTPTQESIHKMAFVQRMACPYEYALLHYHAVMVIHSSDLKIHHKQVSLFNDYVTALMSRCGNLRCCRQLYSRWERRQTEKKMMKTKRRQNARDSHMRLKQDALDIQELVQVLNKSHYVRQHRHRVACKRVFAELSQQVLLFIVLFLFTPMFPFSSHDSYFPRIQRQADMFAQLKSFGAEFNAISSTDDFWKWTNDHISNDTKIWNAPRTTPFVGVNANIGCGCGASVGNTSCVDSEMVGYFLTPEVMLVGQMLLEQDRFPDAVPWSTSGVGIKGGPSCVIPVTAGENTRLEIRPLSTRNLTDTSLQLRKLQDTQWLDRLTHSVKLQMVVFNFNTDVLAFLEFKLEFSASGGYLQTMNHMVGLVDDETWGPTSVVFKGMLFALLVYMIVTRGSLIRKKMRNNKACRRQLVVQTILQCLPGALLIVLLALDAYVDLSLRSLGVDILSDDTSFTREVHNALVALNAETVMISVMVLLSMLFSVTAFLEMPYLGPIMYGIMYSVIDPVVLLFLAIILFYSLAFTTFLVSAFGPDTLFLSKDFATSFFGTTELTIAGEFVTQNEDSYIGPNDPLLSTVLLLFMIVSLLLVNLFIGILSEIYPAKKKSSEILWEKNLTDYLAEKMYSKFWLPSKTKKEQLNSLPSWCKKPHVDPNLEEEEEEEGQNPSIDAGLYLFSYQGKRLLHLARKLAVLHGRDGLHFYKRVESLDAPPKESLRERKRQQRLAKNKMSS